MFLERPIRLATALVGICSDLRRRRTCAQPSTVIAFLTIGGGGQISDGPTGSVFTRRRHGDRVTWSFPANRGCSSWEWLSRSVDRAEPRTVRRARQDTAGLPVINREDAVLCSRAGGQPGPLIGEKSPDCRLRPGKTPRRTYGPTGSRARSASTASTRARGRVSGGVGEGRRRGEALSK